ncbi:MAG: hypothetical protein EZS28_037382, partial [Streblomastix strix]
MDLFLNSVRI